MWQDLSDEEKKKFDQMAEEEKAKIMKCREEYRG